MVISKNSQLGLRFDTEKQVEFLTLMKDYFDKELGINKEMIEYFSRPPESYSVEEIAEIKKNVIPADFKHAEVRDKVTDIIQNDNWVIITDDKSKYFFICESVYKAANLIKVTEWFTGRTLKDITFGKYTYLMGKNRMVRFVVGNGAIRGFYFDDKNQIAFEFGIEMENGGYFYNVQYQEEFTMVMQVLTFVELGDIEVIELAGGRNNGKSKKDSKITNTAKNTVYVVDSSWNKLIIRTEGFAVRGHFKLQPCGPGSLDRKLIWVNAFEKHGYTRKPKAEIVR